MEERELFIDCLSEKGYGIGRLDDGTRVEVPFGLPGDELLVEVGKKRRKKALGYLREVLKPSELRTAPLCLHAQTCGGCAWQQMSYSAQLQEKQKRITALFAPFAVDIPEILPCAHPWQYRNKMEFSFAQFRDGQRFLGLMRSASKGAVINLQECHLISPWVSRALNAVRNWWKTTLLRAYHPHRDEGTLRTLIIRESKRTSSKLILLTISGNPDYPLDEEHLKQFIQCITETFEEEEIALFLRIQKQRRGSPTEFQEIHLKGPSHLLEELHIPLQDSTKPFYFKIRPSSFFQPNSLQAELLFGHIFKMAAEKPKAVILDLYAGTGTLALLLSALAKKVIAIELNPEAVADGLENSRLNSIDNIEFICGDVGKKLFELKTQRVPFSPDLVILDPPRCGLSPDALKLLLELSPQEIIYVSCNPKTQVENIKVLTEGGYTLKQLQPVDQFPHTVHIENIALLSKSSFFS